MITKLNNSNGNSSSVTNQKLKELETQIEELKSDIRDIQEVDRDLQEQKANKADLHVAVTTQGVLSNAVSTDFLATDSIESRNNSDVKISDNVTVEGDVTANKVNATGLFVDNVDVVESLGNRISQAQTDASNAVDKADLAETQVESVNQRLTDYSDAMSRNIQSEHIGAGTLNSDSIYTPALTVTFNADMYKVTAQETKTKAELMTAFLEPTAKDETEYYLFRLPAHFNGVAHFIAYENDTRVFSVDFNLQNQTGKKGTGIVVHSARYVEDFYQILYNPTTDVYSFVTKSNISRLWYKYDSYDSVEEVTYETYPNLTDQGPDYSRDNLKYTAKHSDQVVVIGDEETLNGGLTVHGTFYATGFEVPETVLTNLHIKHQIYGGYDESVGEFNTYGTTGGLLSFSDVNMNDPEHPLASEVVTWFNGSPRQVVRKGPVKFVDDLGVEHSDITFETVKTDATQFIPEYTDSLFDEAGLARYNGTAVSGTNPVYPLTEIGDDSTVHGDIEVLGICKVDTKIRANNIENFDDNDITIRSNKAVKTIATDVEVTGNDSVKITADSLQETLGEERKTVTGKSTSTYGDDFTATVTSGDLVLKDTDNSGVVALQGKTVDVNADVTTIDNRTNIDELKVNKVIGLLENTGDVRTHGQVIADGDITTHGDLIVGGSIVATTETQIATTGDYLVTRENNVAPMASTDNSGIVVNNYDGNGSIASLTANYNGEWRVSDTSSATTTTYTDLSNYNNVWYNGLTVTAAVSHPTGVMTATNMIELSSVALYNGSYYHRNGENWFGPISVVSGQFDLGDMVTDETTKTALDALPTYSLIYYNSVKDTVISISQNQPLLTRDEKSNLTAGSPLVWDSTNERAINTPAPGGEQVWKSSIDNHGNITYGWGVASAGSSFVFDTRADYNAAKLIPLGQVGHIPDGAIVVIKDEDDFVTSENR